MDLLIALLVVVVAWFVFKSLMAVLIALAIACLAVYLVRSLNSRL